MLSEAEVKLLGAAVAILSEYSCDIQDPNDYMDGWRHGRAYSAADEATTNIHRVLRHETHLRERAAETIKQKG